MNIRTLPNIAVKGSKKILSPVNSKSFATLPKINNEIKPPSRIITAFNIEK
jgi:hypothetical protein